MFAVSLFSLLVKGRGLFLNKMSFLYPRKLCVQFGWNCPKDSREKISRFHHYFFTFPSLSPHVIGGLKKLESLSSKTKCFVPSLDEIGQQNLQENMKMWKVNRRINKRQYAINNTLFKLQLRWAKYVAVSPFCVFTAIWNDGIKMLNAYFDSCTKSITTTIFRISGDLLRTTLLGKDYNPIGKGWCSRNRRLNLGKLVKFIKFVQPLNGWIAGDAELKKKTNN